MPREKKGHTYWCNVCNCSYTSRKLETSAELAFRSHRRSVLHQSLEPSTHSSRTNRDASSMEASVEDVFFEMKDEDGESEKDVDEDNSLSGSLDEQDAKKDGSDDEEDEGDKEDLILVEPDEQGSDSSAPFHFELQRNRSAFNEMYWCGEVSEFDDNGSEASSNDKGSSRHDENGSCGDVLDGDDRSMSDGTVGDEREEVEEENGSVNSGSKESDRVLIEDGDFLLSSEECRENDIKRLQDLLLLRLYSEFSPITFNSVNGGKKVNKKLALKLLQYIEDNHLSRKEANEYLLSQHRFAEDLTGKSFDMVRCSKTLKSAFLWATDKKIPLSNCELELPSLYFGDCLTSTNKPLPSIQAPFISLEVTLALLLLKINPEDLILNMDKEFTTITEPDGTESVERLYTGWSSSEYAIEAQELIREGHRTDVNIALIYLSIFVDGGVMSSSSSRSATPVSVSIQNLRGQKYQSLVGFIPEENALSEESLQSILDKKGINKTGQKYILQCTNRQRLWEYLDSIFTAFFERQSDQDGFDVQIGTGDQKKYYRIFVLPTNFVGDHPQMHDLTGVSRSACHLCYKTNFADFFIPGQGNRNTNLNRNGQIPRDPQRQGKAGILHRDSHSQFLNKTIMNDAETRATRKRHKDLLKTVHGYSGHLKVYEIFGLLISQGVGTMIRIFGSDIMHTWTLGFIEAGVGFTLQIVKFIGQIDKTYSSSCKNLADIIQNFPAYNSLQPVRQIRFNDIWELFVPLSSKQKGNPLNTTGILKMRESFKLPSALLQILFALPSSKLLPLQYAWAEKAGFEEPLFSPQQICVNALSAIMEVHWYLNASSLTETQLDTLQMLIANAQAHMLILDVTRKRIITKATSSKDKFVDLKVDSMGLMNNAKSELISHFPEAIRQSGCESSVRDTQLGEGVIMKLCKVLFADTNKRYFWVLKE